MPNRIIKESIRTSRKINNLTDFQFRLWVHLITYVDDYGRGSADPQLLRNLLFPRRKRVRESDIIKALQVMEEQGCIRLYEAGGEMFFCFPGWSNHQSVRTKRSKFPAPVNICMQMHADVPLIQSESESESESREGSPILLAEAAPTLLESKGVFGWVQLTQQQYDSLLADMGKEELERVIRYVDELVQQNGNKYQWKDWYLVLRRAHREGWGIRQERSRAGNPAGSVRKETSYDLDEIEAMIMGRAKGS